MKNLAIILAVISICIYSCTKDENPSENNESGKDTVKTIIDDLKFKLTPVASDQFNISIQGESRNTYKLLLKKKNQEQSDFAITEETNGQGIFSGVIKYDFSPYEFYNIIIQASREDADTVFEEEFTIPGYTHKYYGNFNYEQLASIMQPGAFDFSPSRNIIYFLDYIENKLVLKRLSIADKKLEILDEDFFSLLIRCLDDDHLLVSTGKYNNHFLAHDSCALLKYNVYTRDTSFIDWGSNDYGRYSRTVNNSIMITNPVMSSGPSTYNISLINLQDNSKRRYYAEFVSIREYNFEQIYLGNDMYDFTNFDFTDRLPFLNSSSSIEYYDAKSHYYVTIEYFSESEHPFTYYTRMIIYQDNKIVYEQPFEKGRSLWFPRIIDLDDNKLIFYQYYDYDSVLRYDGYYQLDIATGEITPLQYESDIYYKFDFFTSEDKNSFISVRPYNILKVTIN